MRMPARVHGEARGSARNRPHRHVVSGSKLVPGAGASDETRRGHGLSREGVSPTRLFLLSVNKTDFIPE